jgi:hypothetical protein
VRQSLWIFLISAAALQLAAGQASAVTQYLSRFNDLYGTAGTRLDTCGTCHVNFGNNSEGRNAYGIAFERIPGHASEPAAALMSLESQDPDADGTVSAEEIRALFMPGWSCASLGSASRGPANLADFVDPANPGCTAAPEANCSDGLDDDRDGLVDCADPDCDRSMNGACDTGQLGICALGTLICSEGAELCLADELPRSEGPAGDASCVNSLDDDCDGLIDLTDPGCEQAREAACFDGIDDDLDGAVDCADLDCEGAMNGACDTGEAGICAPGLLSCRTGLAVCQANSGPETEGPALNASCRDALDNDCDGLADQMDPQCEPQAADVFALRLRAPRSLKLRVGTSTSRSVILTADGDGSSQEATADLAAGAAEGLTVGIDPASIKRWIQPGGGATRFRFDADFTCVAPGSWRVEWTATIRAPENSDLLDDVLTTATLVTCR